MGETLAVEARVDLRSRLDEEVLWMRQLLEVSPRLPDEEAAWAWFQGEVG